MKERIAGVAIILFSVFAGVFAKAETATIKATIIGEADEQGWFIIDRFGTGISDTISFNPSSNGFTISVDLMYATTGKLVFKDNNLMIVCFPERTVQLKFESDFLETTAVFSGDFAGVNTFFQTIDGDLKQKTYLSWVNGQAEEASNIDGLEMDLYRDRVAFVKKAKELALDEESTAYLKKHFEYYYYLGLLRYSSIHSPNNKIPKITEIPPVLLKDLTDRMMNNEAGLSSRFFRQLLMEYVRYMSIREAEMLKFEDVSASFNAEFNFAREHLSGKNLQYFLSRYMLNSAQSLLPSQLKRLRSTLVKENAAVDLLAQLDQNLGERLTAKDSDVDVAEAEKVRKYDLELTSPNGKTFGLEDLKGKVIYLDIWASWCGPCRKQFPYAKQLHHKLSKKERKKIVFLYISIDNTETKWKEAYEKLGLEGKMGFSPGGWNSDITRVFKVSSIPRYLIFNKKGELVDHNAPRPSDPRILQMIKQLIKE